MTEPIEINKKLTIDLNWCTINAEGSAFRISTTGDLTISNGTVTAGKNVFHNEGTLTINGGTYKTDGEAMACVYCDGPRLANGGATDFAWHLTINGGTFVSEKQTAISLQNNYYNLNPEGSATLNAGTFTGAAQGAAYDLFIDCGKCIVKTACTFTNKRIYARAIETRSSWINGTEYATSGLHEEIPELPTPDKKQWLFTSEYFDMMAGGENSSFCFDLGVAWAELPIESLAGATVIGIDYGTVPEMSEQGAPEGSWFPAFPAYGLSVVTPVDEESGVIEWLGMSIPYTGLDGKTCTFDMSELMSEDAGTVLIECTLAEELVPIQGQ